MLDPKVAQKLIETVPEVQQLVAHLHSVAQELNNLDGLASLTFTERAYETTARLRAYEKLKKMLDPLLNTAQSTGGTSDAEYVV
jgi:hypothetical protein